MNDPSTASRAAREITRFSALQLSRSIHAREVSCTEVMRAYLAQIDRLNPRVNAIVSLQDPETLLLQAGRRDEELAVAHREGRRVPWMHGFPQAPKDLTNTAGIVTTQGLLLQKDVVPEFDSIIVERIRRGGAILIGKTNVPEFGLGSHTFNKVFGPTLNAFDQTKSAGGSSGGAAVALALELLPVADGSDFMGSLRNPAAWNNVFGFRPSFGRVPFGPSPETFVQQLGTDGPMARTVADLAMLLSTLAGRDERVPLSLDDDPSIFGRPLATDCKGLRIGWLGDFGGYLPMEDGVMATCRQALAHFEAIGCDIEPARPAFSMERLWEAWCVMRHFLVAGKAGALATDPKSFAQLGDAMRWEIEEGLKLTGMAVYRASTTRTAWYGALVSMFDQFDFLVLPSAQVFPFDVALPWPKAIAGRTMDTYHRWMEVVIGPTFAGLPVLNVPAGFGPTGLPMGLQIIGRPRADLAVLGLGHAYDAASRYSTRRSPLLAGL